MIVAINVVVIKNGVVDKIHTFLPSEVKEAEEKYAKLCEQNCPVWKEYDDDDKAAATEDGYTEFDNGSVCLSHSVDDDE